MAKAEEEDKLLLSSLGVTAAKAEDVERKILSEAQEKEDPNSHNGEKKGSAQELDGKSKTQANLLNKLHAINREIQAVSSGLKKGKSVKTDSSSSKEKEKREEKEKGQIDKGKIKYSENLQKALVNDRLKSLKRAKLQIEQELNQAGPSKNGKVTKQEDLIRSLVKDKEKKGKGILRNEAKKSGTDAKKIRIVSYSEDTEFDAVLDAASSGFMETEREKLVRKGMLTPFHKLKGFEKKRVELPSRPSPLPPSPIPILDAREAESVARLNRSMAQIAQSRRTTKLMDGSDLPPLDAPPAPFRRVRAPLKRPQGEGEEMGKGKRRGNKRRRPLPDKKWRKEKMPAGISDEEENEEEMWGTDSDAEESEADIELEGSLNIPSKIYNKLFDYQKIGVQWLWELHCQKAGGIIGDEMGLGKTVQVISFLASLHNSDLYKPSIVVCPVTLLRQWKREAEKWYPQFRVEILHDSAQESVGNKKRKCESEEESEFSESDEELESNKKKRGFKRNPKKWDELIDRVLGSDSGLLITTYEQIRILGEKLIDVNWGYAILDEGHRIRNPNAEITLICKQFRTMHRIIMSGAPIQNKLAELWSLFDFVFPGKLGVLPVFEAEFSVPITVGGYVNANPLQVSTAYRCAVVLRDLIMPYLLRRMKADVDAQLPKKTEQVLFCSLTPEQRSIYKSFLASSEVEQIFDGRKNSLAGIDVLKKICNHPDLLERETSERNPDYGNFERSGKMKLVEQVLKLWKEQGNRVLFFAQTQQMLDIMEGFLNERGYVYRRMDGITPVKHRMALMDEFNNSSEVFIFILTTRVGGLGTNLTGANRVILYDPDWNPSTDAQARERAWRIGQKRDVTVYRLLTKGTIEEKIYQRQIYKHFLTDKVLKDPRQKRVFKAKDMRDLFTLQDDNETTETSNIFAHLKEDINVGVESEKQHDKSENGEKKDDKGKGKEKAGEEEEEERERADGGETSILKSLFDANGIHSAMNHDAIINANDDQQLRMEASASQVALRAAEAVRRSRLDRVREPFSVPTWTGRAGSAGAPPSARPRFGSNPQTRAPSHPVRPAHPVRREPGPPPGRVGGGIGVGVRSGRALSSAEVLGRIRGTQASADSEAMEQVAARLADREGFRRRRAVPAGARDGGEGLRSEANLEGSRRRLVPAGARNENRRDSSEGSRRRVSTALPAGAQTRVRNEGGFSSDSSEASRRRIPTVLPVGGRKRSANRADLPSDSSEVSRRRVIPTALPAGASNNTGANRGDLSSDSSEASRRRRALTAVPVGARTAGTNGGDLSSDSSQPSRKRIPSALPAVPLPSDSSEGSRRRAVTALPAGNVPSESSEGSRRRAVTALPAVPLPSDSSEGSRRRVVTALPAVPLPSDSSEGSRRRALPAGNVPSDSSEGSRRRVMMALPVRAVGPNGRYVPLADIGLAEPSGSELYASLASQEASE